MVCNPSGHHVLTESLSRGGNATSLQIFLIVSTSFLYLVAAGLLSKGVWHLENNEVCSLALPRLSCWVTKPLLSGLR